MCRKPPPSYLHLVLSRGMQMFTEKIYLRLKHRVLLACRLHLLGCPMFMRLRRNSFERTRFSYNASAKELVQRTRVDYNAYTRKLWKELVSVTAWAYRRLEMWLQNPSPCLFRKSWWVADQMNLKRLHLCTLLGRKTISSCTKEKERLKGRLLFPVREKIKYFRCNVIRLKPNLASSGSTNHHGRFEIQAWRASTG